MGGLWLCSIGGHTNTSNLHLSTVTFVVDSGAEVTVISTDTARKGVRDCTGKPAECMGDRYLALKGLLGHTFAKTTAAPVRKRLLSVAALVETGHVVTIKRDRSYVWQLGTGRWQNIRRDHWALDLFATAQEIPKHPAIHSPLGPGPEASGIGGAS